MQNLERCRTCDNTECKERKPGYTSIALFLVYNKDKSIHTLDHAEFHTKSVFFNTRSGTLIGMDVPDELFNDEEQLICYLEKAIASMAEESHLVVGRYEA